MKWLNYLLSTKVSFVLFIAYASAMGAATFIENDHGTAVARAVVYEAWWFEVLMIWMAVNFIAHIQHYKLFTKKRWPVGLFHIAFVVIIFGAGVSRYFGNEGMIHIRQGQAEQYFSSTANYLQLEEIKEVGHHKRLDKRIELNGLSFKAKAVEMEMGDQPFTVHFDELVKGAREEFVAGQDTLIDMAVAIGAGREDYLLQKGERLNFGKLVFSTEKNEGADIQLFKQDSTWMVKSRQPIHLVEMSSQKMGILEAGIARPLQLKTLYQVDSGAFLVKGIYEGKELRYMAEKEEVMAKELPDMLRLRVEDKNKNTVFQTYTPLAIQDPKRHIFFSGDKKFSVAYGPRKEKLPFALKLNAFELERYPGSKSPASYASDVSVIDHETSFPFRIFMNNVLDHKGYRFFQASYDTDEKGTVLSVSQDRPGTYITYFGYLLLTIGMFFTLFAKGSRFNILNNRLKSMNRVKGAAVIIFLMMGIRANAHEELPDVGHAVLPVEQAQAYGLLIVQDLDGRMKPLNTLANEITRKLSGSSSVTVEHAKGTVHLNAEQFLLAVQMYPYEFSRLPLIKVDPEKAAAIFKVLQHSPVKSISFIELLDKEGRYLLQGLVEEANRLKPAERNEGHKELLKVDERFNIFYAILSGDFLRLFPNRLDSNNTWFTAQQHTMGFDEQDGNFVKNITPMYMAALQKGAATGKWDEAGEVLGYMQMYQQKAGATVYPAEDKVKAELFYNKLKLGNHLFGIFWLLGIAMLVLSIIKLFTDAKWLRYSWGAGLVLGWIGLTAFTFHLGLRWYISGHAPWSDGFEMLTFVAWGVLLFGLLFGKSSHFTVPLGILFSGTLLFVSFLDWLNPEITNLMPVLASYWLKIHVAVIVSGYAPLALAAIMALFTLLLLLFKPKVPTGKWWKSMQELTLVNEMAITIGLFLLAIGTFLGGVWANESWGRYWAWDPKETWALVSVIVYGFVLHLRLVPKFKNALVFNLVSMWAFSTIVMTSFGVNYYLSGLHSYASGDPVPVPIWVYYVIAVLAIVSIFAYLKYRNLSGKERKDLMAV